MTPRDERTTRECPTCGGGGILGVMLDENGASWDETCPVCQGTGQIPEGTEESPAEEAEGGTR